MRGQKGDKGDAWGAVLLKMALPVVYIRVVCSGFLRLSLPEDWRSGGVATTTTTTRMMMMKIAY